MKRRVELSRLLWTLLLAGGSLPAAWAAEKTALDLLPDSTVIYAEMSQPKALISTVLDHPLALKLQAREEYRKAYETPQYQQFRFAVSLVEQRIGTNWRAALESITEGGIFAGFDAKSQGVAVLVRSGDPQRLEKLRETLFDLARQDAKQKQTPDPIKDSEYRGIKAWRADQLRMAILGPWLVLTNKDELGQAIADRWLDEVSANPSRKSLSSSEQVRAARASLSGAPTAWAFVDLNVVRSADMSGKLAKGPTDNPVAELLAGGLFGTFAKAPYATVGLYVEKENIRLVAATPHQDDWISPARQYFFGPGGRGTAPDPLLPKGTVLSIGTYRDLAGMWANAADLFDERVNAGMIQADSKLSSLFSGREFSKEILGSLEPQMQLVVARQDFAAKTGPQPSIKLPAFALVLQLKDPAKVERTFKVSFQSLVGFANILGANNGQPQLELHDDQHGKGQLVAATYILDEQAADKNDKINYNFSPALAFVGNRMMLASTRQLAEELIDLAGAQTSSSATPQANTEARVEIAALREVLTDNRKQLVAQNMLEKGHNNDQAEKEVSGYMEALGWLRDATLQLNKDAKSIRLELNVRLAPQ